MRNSGSVLLLAASGWVLLFVYLIRPDLLLVATATMFGLVAYPVITNLIDVIREEHQQHEDLRKPKR